MDDAEYLFRQTERERKRNGYGDRCKKRQGGRTVRLGTDYMSEAQIKKQHGEIKTMNMNKPTSYDQLKNWPEDIQREYFARLDELKMTRDEIAQMLGCHPATVSFQRRQVGFAMKHGPRPRRNDQEEERLKLFLAGLLPAKDEPAQEPVVAAEPADEPAQEPEVEEEHADKPEPEKDSEHQRITLSKPVSIVAEPDSLAVLITALRGTGAKVTIELML